MVYELSVAAPLSARLAGSQGSELELLTHQVTTESSSALYGFSTEGERFLFRILLTAQGVGARLALAMISTLAPHRLARALAESDHAALSQVPGIGRRTAEKISVSLRSKAKALAAAVPASADAAPAAATAQALSALVGLGIAPDEAERRVRAALAEPGGSELSPEELTRRALAAA